jgi:hypothetical protein
MPTYHLAQLNIGRIRAPLDSPLMETFVRRLPDINAIADRAPGFVWRLQTEDGDATAVRPFGDDRILVNMSVWESLESLHAYVYRSGHAEVMRRRREWFERMEEAYVVLWWVPAGHRPTIGEAKERLGLLRSIGASPAAFTYRQPFPPPEQQPGPQVEPFPDECPAS